MRRIATTLALVGVLALGACETRTQDDASPTSPDASAAAQAGVDVTEHESGPQSPISFGLEVPEGATQLGPLVRYRSAALIEAYQPQLDAAEAEQERANAEGQEVDGVEPSPTETETPATRPSDDTFALIDDAPRPDVTISLLRVDGDPTMVLRRLIAQVNAVIPDADLVDDDLSQFCRAREKRITGCTVQARGLTADRRDVRITITADPGDVTTRTAYPASEKRPVMTVRAEYMGDPRSGQLEPRARTAEVPRDVEGKDRSGLIWPSMDVSEPRDAPLLDGRWTVPATGTLLLSGERPRFAAVSADRVREADAIAQDFASSIGTPTKDVVEDLNEISTTYTSRGKDGSAARATFVLSARGSYAMLFYTPPPAKD
jgi:hypothetical protein